jgi:hypothetical protein
MGRDSGSNASWLQSANTLRRGNSTELAFAYDMTIDEVRRRKAFLEAVGDNWDPVQVLADEDMAHRMLYSGLDNEQQRIFEDLVRAGVLPNRT